MANACAPRTCEATDHVPRRYFHIFALSIANHRQRHRLLRRAGVDQALELFRAVDLGTIEGDNDVVLHQARAAGGAVLIDVGDDCARGVGQFRRRRPFRRDPGDLYAQVSAGMGGRPTGLRQGSDRQNCDCQKYGAEKCCGYT